MPCINIFHAALKFVNHILLDPMMLSSGLKLFISLMLTGLGILFIKTKLSSWSYLFIHHPTRAICYLSLEKIPCYVSWLHVELDQIL